MSEATYQIIPRALLETCAKGGDTLARVFLEENAEVIVVHPATVIRVQDGIVYVATSEALKRHGMDAADQNRTEGGIPCPQPPT